MGSRGKKCSRALGIAAVLACWLASAGGVWASSAIKMKVDPYDRAGARGVTIFDLRYVTVALYGSDGFDVRTINLDTLRLGTRDTVGARPLRHFRGERGHHAGFGFSREARIEDVNKDGFRDMLLTFRMADIGLRAGEHVRVALQATLRNGIQIRAFDGVVRSSDPIDSCGLVESGGLVVGYRCQFTSSFEPIDWPSFLNQVNSALAGTTTYQITDQTPIVVEGWGGAGDDGASEFCTADNNAKGGGGGAAGYARTVLTVGDLETQLGSDGDLYVEVGESSTETQGGGSSTVVVGQAVTAISSANVTAPANQAVFVIAGGGGGGGKGTCVNGITAEGGYHGGKGAGASANTSAAASAAGGDAESSHEGKGGNPSGSGAGGSGDKDGKDGTSGIGGFGSDAQTLWNGSSVTAANWTNGTGGEGGQGKGGGGGGGFGGGGGGGGTQDHKGGGGGGGSWARQSTIADSQIDDSNIFVGPDGETAPTAALTFQLIPLNN